MTGTSKNSVIVELYDNTLTERKDDRFGRVVSTKSLSEDDLIAIAVEQRTEYSVSTLRAVMEIMRNVAMKEIANGASVKFGFAHFNLGVSGVFIGDNAKWDASQHSLWVKAVPTAELRQAIANCTVDVRGMATVGIVLNVVTDVATGEENSRITPGGGINLSGSKIKIDGDDPQVGISLINQATGEIIRIAKNTILVNEPSRISFIAPATLPYGDYKLSLCTQFSPSAKTLKEARTVVFDYILAVTQ